MSQFFLISLFFTPFTHKNHSQSNLLFHFSSSKLRNFGFASSYRSKIDVLFRLLFSFLLHKITQHDLYVNKEFALGFIPISHRREMRFEISEWISRRGKICPGRFKKIDNLRGHQQILSRMCRLRHKSLTSVFFLFGSQTIARVLYLCA